MVFCVIDRNALWNLRWKGSVLRTRMIIPTNSETFSSSKRNDVLIFSAQLCSVPLLLVLLWYSKQELGSYQYQENPVQPRWQQSCSSGRKQLWVCFVWEASTHQTQHAQRSVCVCVCVSIQNSFWYFCLRSVSQTFYHGEPVPVSVEINNQSSRNIKDISLSGESPFQFIHLWANPTPI